MLFVVSSPLSAIAIVVSFLGVVVAVVGSGDDVVVIVLKHGSKVAVTVDVRLLVEDATHPML